VDPPHASGDHRRINATGPLDTPVQQPVVPLGLEGIRKGQIETVPQRINLLGQIRQATEEHRIIGARLHQKLQQLFSTPYDTPSVDMAARYDRLKPREFFSAGGVSHYSCSS